MSPNCPGWVWFEHSSECNLLQLIAANISRHQLTCAITSFEGFVRNPPVFCSVSKQRKKKKKKWQPLFVFFFSRTEYYSWRSDWLKLLGDWQAGTLYLYVCLNCWGTADAEMRVSSSENPVLSMVFCLKSQPRYCIIPSGRLGSKHQLPNNNILSLECRLKCLFSFIRLSSFGFMFRVFFKQNDVC